MTKYILLLVAIMIFAVGCDLTSRSMKYYNDCKGDNECIKLMQQNYNTTHVIVSKAVDSVGVGGLGEIVGCVAGSIASFLTGILAGKRIQKKRGA